LDSLPSRRTSLGRAEGGGEQLGIEVLGELVELPVGESAHVAIAVVVGRAALRRDATAAFDHHVIALGDEAMVFV
jgi:hypothetical protein